MTSILNFIGNTPLVRLYGFEKKYALKGKIFAKLEYFNPFGSIKDRAALQIINDAEKRGELKEDSYIIEASSGNMGISLSAIAAIKGNRCKILMPENASEARKTLIKHYDAELILTDSKYGMKGAMQLADKLIRNDASIYSPKQFENPSNPASHKIYTAAEIESQLMESPDAIVVGIGSGGTITGLGEYFKEKGTYIVGVEPLSSPYLTRGVTGIHKIQGIGAGFKPKILNLSIIDEIIPAPDEDAEEMCKNVAKTDSIAVGISSGAVLYAAKKIAIRADFEEKNIVVIIPDNFERYI